MDAVEGALAQVGPWRAPWRAQDEPGRPGPQGAGARHRAQDSLRRQAPSAA